MPRVSDKPTPRRKPSSVAQDEASSNQLSIDQNGLSSNIPDDSQSSSPAQADVSIAAVNDISLHEGTVSDATNVGISAPNKDSSVDLCKHASDGTDDLCTSPQEINNIEGSRPDGDTVIVTPSFHDAHAFLVRDPYSCDDKHTLPIDVTPSFDDRHSLFTEKHGKSTHNGAVGSSSSPESAVNSMPLFDEQHAFDVNASRCSSRKGSAASSISNSPRFPLGKEYTREYSLNTVGFVDDPMRFHLEPILSSNSNMRASDGACEDGTATRAQLPRVNENQEIMRSIMQEVIEESLSKHLRPLTERVDLLIDALGVSCFNTTVASIAKDEASTDVASNSFDKPVGSETTPRTDDSSSPRGHGCVENCINNHRKSIQSVESGGRKSSLAGSSAVLDSVDENVANTNATDLHSVASAHAQRILRNSIKSQRQVQEREERSTCFSRDTSDGTKRKSSRVSDISVSSTQHDFSQLMFCEAVDAESNDLADKERRRGGIMQCLLHILGFAPFGQKSCWRTHQILVFVLLLLAFVAHLAIVVIGKHGLATHVSSMIYTLAGLCGVGVARQYGLQNVSEPRGSALQDATCYYQQYARSKCFYDAWLHVARWSCLKPILMWKLASIGWCLMVVSSHADASNEEVALVIGIPVLGSLVYAAFICYALQVCCYMEMIVDNYCVKLFGSSDFVSAIHDWNAVQIIIRQVSVAMEACVLILMTASVASVVVAGLPLLAAEAMMTDKVTTSSWALFLSCQLVLSLSALFRISAVTESCQRVAPLVNSMCVSGGQLRMQKQILVTYVEQSSPGLYVRGARFTGFVVLTMTYVLSALLIICLVLMLV
eukprot:TRINITY_DN17980_c0_g4_i1.p1 TRINITY_DN17980_c0_g4~~TRINITY_DN17980_c0_g4_i1.p1  ORF type:complete len:842 (+),score=61.20 TRINITY_DN17980_c0_g4_i1:42-2528(+)